LLADTGLGGGRRQGWGRFEVECAEWGQTQELVWGRPRSNGQADQAVAEERGWWLLSLFSPGETDQIDWTRGSFRFVERGGRVDGHGSDKLHSRMVGEGSLLLGGRPRGRAWNVAPPEFLAHPVWRAGYAVALEVPWRAPL
jgi:CRISPR/Cas system CSM-associated protein Csm4 (group 5 of RAMP superfamily)